jgi:tRNA pseudouridine38-40 synthase
VGLIETAHPILGEHLAVALNERLPRDIAVLDAREVAPDFDVMADVTRKAYRYTICTGRLRPVQQIRFCYHYLGRLNVEAMQAAARHVVGTQDFRSFAVKLDEGQKTVRTVFRCEVTRTEGGGDRDWITIDVEGDGFLPHMVRLIAGTLVDIGRGHWRPEEMVDILAARDRQAAGHLAPASGLCLEWIRFRQDDPAPPPASPEIG